MRAWSSARFGVPLPAGHRFPIAKYGLIRDGMVARGLLAAHAIAEPGPADPAELALAHTGAYISTVLSGAMSEAAQRRLGFPWGPELRERSLRTVGGTIEACRDALGTGSGLNLAGGTHHAFGDHGEGFCVFNDVAVAVRTLQRDNLLGRAAVVDLDVHQGNGTAALFAGDPRVYTFSMHGAKNYPFRKERSRLDVELDDGADDATYLRLLDRHLEPVLDEARPDLVVYLAGADPFAGDRFGRLALSIDGLRRRDRAVFAACRARGIPVAVTLAGGYASDLADVVTIHANTVVELRASHA